MAGEKIKKIKDAQSSECNGMTTTERDETKTRAVTYDTTKAASTSNGIIDIVDEPDVAVWSKGIMKKINTPADKVQRPSLIKSTTTNIEYDERREKQSHLQQTVDPANKEDVGKAIGPGSSLTDQSTSFIQRSKKEASSTEQKPSKIL
jgi:hypothetical protein